MKSWMLLRFSLEDVAAGVVARLMRDFTSCAPDLRDLDDVGVFSSELGNREKWVYFSPGAAAVFASTLAKLPAEHCDLPNPEGVVLLYGDSECLRQPDKPVDEVKSPRLLRLDELVE